MTVELKQTWDDDRLRRERLALVQAQMKRLGIAAMYIGENASVRYLLNLKIPSSSAFVPLEGEVIAFMRPRDEGYVKLHYANVRPPLYDSASAWGPGTAQEGGTDLLVRSLTALMEEHGVAGERLGVEKLDLPAFQALSGAGMELTYAQPAIEYARAIKTQDEVEIYRQIGGQYEHAMRAFRDALRPGITENELAAVVVAAWYEAGGEDIAQLNVCAGENMNPWRRWPSQRTVREGEFVGVDLHGFGAGGLRGDASRTFFVGDHPSDEQRELYATAYEYLKATTDAFRAGRTYAEAMELVPPVADKYEFQLFNLQVAHAIGMSHSGYPEVEMRKPPIDDTLKENQVLAIESYFGEVGGTMAVKLEDFIVVRDGAPEVLGPDMPFDERFVTP